MNVEDVLDEQKIDYTEQSSGYLTNCINPDHEDKNPSMLINKITGRFHCFSCKFTGNILQYYNKYADKLSLSRNSLTALIEEKMSEVEAQRIPKDAVPFIGTWRGISGKTLRKFQAFISAEEPSRITFPLRDLTNDIVGFIGRHMDDGEPKYKITPKGVKLPLFPLAEPVNGRILLVEGIVDALNLWDKGLTNATAAFGVANVGKEKLELLSMQGTEGIDILFDGDTAGREAARKLNLLCKELKIESRLIKLKEGEDPGAMTKKEVKTLRKKLYG